MASWKALADLFSRTVHKGQLDIFGNEAAETTVRPKADSAAVMRYRDSVDTTTTEVKHDAPTGPAIDR